MKRIHQKVFEGNLSVCIAVSTSEFMQNSKKKKFRKLAVCWDKLNTEIQDFIYLHVFMCVREFAYMSFHTSKHKYVTSKLRFCTFAVLLVSTLYVFTFISAEIPWSSFCVARSTNRYCICTFKLLSFLYSTLDYCIA